MKKPGMRNYRHHPLGFILIFYLVCFVFRAGEYLFIRTDQSIIGEAFIHKLAGIALLAWALHLLDRRWADIGFTRGKAGRGVLFGALLGGGVYLLAYGIEILVLGMSESSPELAFYVTSYAVQGNRVMQNSLLFVLVCIAGNIINVVMEEGVFRGLFVRLMEEKYSFALACTVSSVLFGIWHIAQPVRNVIDGQQSAAGAAMTALALVGTSTLLGIQYCMLAKITGSLWAGLTAHFISNAGINLVHVVTPSGADKLQILRISIAQSVSFIIILVLFLRDRTRKKKKIIV